MVILVGVKVVFRASRRKYGKVGVEVGVVNDSRVSYADLYADWFFSFISLGV